MKTYNLFTFFKYLFLMTTFAMFLNDHFEVAHLRYELNLVKQNQLFIADGKAFNTEKVELLKDLILKKEVSENE